MSNSLLNPHFRLYGTVIIILICLTSIVYLLQDSIPVEKASNLLKAELAGIGSRIRHETALQYDPPPEQKPFGDVVIAAQSTTDLTWTIFPKVK